jgi:uncharacterized peroxidase-related enzyme
MESHESDLRAEIHDEKQVRRLQDDYRGAALDPPTSSLLDFAVKLSLRPKDMEESDIAALRTVGFDDQTILDAVQTITYFNYSNRVMDALGIEPEPEMRHRRTHP